MNAGIKSLKERSGAVILYLIGMVETSCALKMQKHIVLISYIVLFISGILIVIALLSFIKDPGFNPDNLNPAEVSKEKLRTGFLNSNYAAERAA